MENVSTIGKKINAKKKVIQSKFSFHLSKIRWLPEISTLIYYNSTTSIDNCFKPEYAIPKSDGDNCQQLPEPKVEECQRLCQEHTTMDLQGNIKPCLQFTFYEVKNEFGVLGAECCLYIAPTSSYDNAKGAISGPSHCGMLI